ncbi:hypothetical protein [Hymenobacter terrigena]
MPKTPRNLGCFRAFRFGVAVALLHLMVLKVLNDSQAVRAFLQEKQLA